MAEAPSSVTARQAKAPDPGELLRITLADAIKRAKVISPTVQLALTNARIAAARPLEVRVANLPVVTATSQYLYTEGNGTPAARFIANNGVHEYIAQADVHQGISVANIILYHQSLVAGALSKDQAEIATRGLTVAVVQAYAILVAADGKLKTIEEALDAAQQFLKTTQALAQGGEVARADVVKAQIQLEDGQVAYQDAKLVCENAKYALALMLFPDVYQNYEVVDDPSQMLLLPAFADAQAAALHQNPALDAAFKTERIASEGVKAARAAYLPTMTFDYFYGIDANHFATKTPATPTEGSSIPGKPIQNLGYSALASISIPIWDWGSTRSKVRSAEDLKKQAIQDRTYAERKLSVDLEQFYSEAQVAEADMDVRRQSAANAVDSRKLTLLRYKAGEATALEVVNAEATVSLEKNAYYDAQTRYAIALANLATLTGTL